MSSHRSSRKTTRRTPRQHRLPNTINRPLRAVDDTFTVVQSLELNGGGALTSSTTVPTFFSIPISLSGFDQVSQLVAVFDYYRFLEAEYTFLPRVRSTVSNDQAFSVTPNLGVFHSVVDTNTITNLTSVPQALDYPSCKAWTPGGPNNQLVQRFVPKILIGNAAAVTNNNKTAWYSTGANTIAWAGVLTAQTITSQVYSIDVIIRVKMQFKNCR